VWAYEQDSDVQFFKYPPDVASCQGVYLTSSNSGTINYYCIRGLTEIPLYGNMEACLFAVIRRILSLIVCHPMNGALSSPCLLHSHEYMSPTHECVRRPDSFITPFFGTQIQCGRLRASEGKDCSQNSNLHMPLMDMGMLEKS
jgi:hypothetical protein